jgi:hypothetical protein
MAAMRDHGPEAGRETGTSSRRALLASAAGAAGALMAGAFVRPQAVRAEGETVVVGGEYTTATSVTRIANSANSNTVIQAETNGGVAFRAVVGSGEGLHVQGQGMGVVVDSMSTAIWGNSAASAGYQKAGVLGTGALLGDDVAVGVWGASHGNAGVLGESVTSAGVAGLTESDAGVYGQAETGAGVFGRSTSGFAFHGDGRLRFERVTGVATIAAGSRTVTVDPGVNIVASSFVLLSPKANIGSRGLWFTTDPAGNRFTIRMSSSRGSPTPVAWMLVG